MRTCLQGLRRSVSHDVAKCVFVFIKISAMRYMLALLILVLSITIEAQQPSNPSVNTLDTALIHRLTGVQGAWNNGEYKITIPQNQMEVIVDSFRIIPAMGLSSWVGFTPVKEG